MLIVAAGMVFSFFKKAPEKMVAKPAAVPRPKEGVAAPSAEAKPVPAQPDKAADEGTNYTDSAIEFSDFVFSESSPDFQIEGDVDPIDAAIEEAAVLPLLAAKMAPGGVVLCETEREADLPEQAGALTLVKQYNYGKIKVSRYERGEEV